MKRTRKIVLFLVLTPLVLIAVNCEQAENNPGLSDSAVFTTVAPGGCNLSEDLLKQSQDEEQPDTLALTFVNDSLKIFTGVNYICCAPFETDQEVRHDTIFIYITDICPDPYNDCYCRCMCYYTWDFLFTSCSGNEKVRIEFFEPDNLVPFLCLEDSLD